MVKPTSNVLCLFSNSYDSLEFKICSYERTTNAETDFIITSSKACVFLRIVAKLYQVEFVLPVTWSKNYVVTDNKRITYWKLIKK